MNQRRLSATDYAVGWLCALPIELAAAQVVLNETHQAPLYDKTDTNVYTFGRIGGHNVVLTSLPAGQMGTTPAAVGATRMLSTFNSIRFGLMVGIGGGVPSSDADIRLGDVVISQPSKQYGGVVQYDYGKTGKDSNISRIGSLNTPPRALLNAVSQLRAGRYQQMSTFEPHLSLFDQVPHFRRDSTGPDVLFKADYYHHNDETTCNNCNKSSQIHRSERQPEELVNIHYGTIASGNQVIKDGLTRDKLSKNLGGVLCFEMEAAGLMNDFPCLVVRGICDYADSHKNKTWQPYAAATASACAKAILLLVPAAETAPGEATKVIEAQDFKIPFILKGVPVGKMASRPHDSEAIERALLTQDPKKGRRIMVLHGLGGMGKTQLAADFVRRYKNSFSAVIWLDGSSESSLKQSLALCANRIPEGQIPERSRTYGTQSQINVDVVVKDVLEWLDTPGNDNWLLAVDNVDRDPRDEDPEAYDIETYLPQADHGAVLITTRLVSLGQLGEPREVKKVDIDHARAIFEVWYGKTLEQEANELLALLDGLPLALAHAAAYMSEHGITFDTYARLYQDQWKELMEDHNGRNSLRTYGNRSVATTWMISFKAIQKRNEAAANLLLLWAHLDNGSLWYGLIAPKRGRRASKRATTQTSLWIGDIAKKEIEFIKAIRLLRSYSLVEETEDQTGWVMHSVVHQWALNIQDDKQRAALSWIAIVLVGYAVPKRGGTEFFKLVPRYLPHVQQCSRTVERNKDTMEKDQNKDDRPLIWSIYYLGWFYRQSNRRHKDDRPLIWSIYYLGWFYRQSNRRHKAEVMFKHALQIYEKALGDNHPVKGTMAKDLSMIYVTLRRYDDAERLANQAFLIMDSNYGQEHTETLIALRELGRLHSQMGQTDDAEKELQRAVSGLEKTCGPEDHATLIAVGLLGDLYCTKSMWSEAEKMYKRVLSGRIKLLGPEHFWTMCTCSDLGRVYLRTGSLGKSEDFLQRAQRGFENLFGPDDIYQEHHFVQNIGMICDIYCQQGRLEEAREFLRKFEYGVFIMEGEGIRED
ncbi:hypothetical protein DM02DRAFT_656953 [Periconia macrospinosa]|uniref:Purine and uridine phosphorylase n=1 Tax=Periconia macrospinosa TaxID=97972 RepID=A0A2V1DKV2_9PLEO|nr:hypothetical protein DM02DRAFT_656953 [Periconia macrospinosa]